MFEFINYNPLTDGTIDLILSRKAEGNEAKGYLPAYHFNICLHLTKEVIGIIDIRIGSNFNTDFGGNIGYTINEPHRGQGYAAKACQLIKQVAIDHGMTSLKITCNPDNWASRRTCENAGLVLNGIVDLPEDNDMYLEGERQKCVYEWVMV